MSVNVCPSSSIPRGTIKEKELGNRSKRSEHVIKLNTKKNHNEGSIRSQTISFANQIINKVK